MDPGRLVFGSMTVWTVGYIMLLCGIIYDHRQSRNLPKWIINEVHSCRNHDCGARNMNVDKEAP